MRKRLITPVPQVSPPTDQHWFDLGSVATVEVTSETKGHPIESALLLSETRGWRAAQPGAQLIRLLFDHPLRQFFPRDCTAAMEFQPARDSTGSGGLLG